MNQRKLEEIRAKNKEKQQSKMNNGISPKFFKSRGTLERKTFDLNKNPNQDEIDLRKKLDAMMVHRY